MSLIIATGSNIGDSLNFLRRAKSKLEKVFNFVAESRVYASHAVDYENQPDFFNQVLEFELPDLSPDSVMQTLLEIEKEFGRKRDIPKGPRTIDLDILFYGLEEVQTESVTVPHPRLFQRSFVVLPLQELPYYETLSQKFEFPTSFDVIATPIIN
jgi:2-amino-4-hydroxy-6-hydroxymethyldihydropteridine diphosphokinase